MALPNEYITSSIAHLQERIQALSPDELTALPPLDSADYEMIGHYIQSYNFIDLNLRRALAIFHANNLLPEHLRTIYPDFQDVQLAHHLSSVLKSSQLPGPELDATVKNLEEIGLYRAYRNILGHWAGKRFPREDVIIFASKTDRNARRVFGRSLAAYNIQIAIVGRSQFRELTGIVAGLSSWLALQIPTWYNQCSTDLEQ